MEDEIEEVENMTTPARPKRLNSKKKGNRVELELTKILTKKLGKPFSRSVGSGNRGWQVRNLPKHAKETFSGDLCPPEGFRWVIECKGGYDVDLNGMIGEERSALNKFIAQSSHDAEQSGRKPLIVWKRTRRPWVAMVRRSDLGDTDHFSVYMQYKEWTIVALDELLDAFPASFWFEI